MNRLPERSVLALVVRDVLDASGRTLSVLRREFIELSKVLADSLAGHSARNPSVLHPRRVKTC